MRTARHRQRRSGTVVVLAALMLVAIVGLLALAVDLGYLQNAKTELQRSADAAAIAATWELIDPGVLTGTANPNTDAEHARTAAGLYAYDNAVAGARPGLATADVVVGRLDNPSDPNTQMIGTAPYNAVTVRVRRMDEQNGEVPLFFARALGMDSRKLEAQATAAFLDKIAGVRAPSDGSCVDLLPFALDEETWNNRGQGPDEWTWDGNHVVAGHDEIPEINLYPQGTGSPGNRGTVDIGSPNNSTADIARQILHGISPQDFAYLPGGKLDLSSGSASLNGDPGISAGVKDELASIRGQRRTIPLYRAPVVKSGNNATYTIVALVGVRIMDVKLTGSMSSKRVTVQPAWATLKGGIPAGSNGAASDFVHSPVWLVPVRPVP